MHEQHKVSSVSPGDGQGLPGGPWRGMLCQQCLLSKGVKTGAMKGRGRTVEAGDRVDRRGVVGWLVVLGV